MDYLDDIFQYKNEGTVCGLTDELLILYYYHYFINHDENILILTNSLYDSNMVYQKLRTYNSDVYLFPMDDFLASVAIALSPDLKIKRLETLQSIKKNKKSIVVTNLMGYLRYLPNKEENDKSNIKLNKNDEIKREELIEKLENLGYKRTSTVTTTGEYALRGYIIDIFPIEYDHPIRMEFFGDEIDSIRFFNESSQLSINEINKCEILPIDELHTSIHSNILDYLNNPMVFNINRNQILNEYEKLYKDVIDYRDSKGFPDDTRFMYSLDEIKQDKYIDIETINNIKGSLIYNSKPMINFKGDYDKFVDYCKSEVKNNTVEIYLSKEQQINKISELLPEASVNSHLANKINIINKKINDGFVIDNHVVISEYNIDDERIYTNYRSSLRMGTKIKDFNDIKIGDYVVHVVHGIGVYGGIKAIEKNGLIRDYIVINYLGNDKVYIPVEKITTIYKYADKDGTKPHINKLNSSNWAKTKLKVNSRIHDISDELIKLYAERSNTKGPIFNTYPDEEVFGSQFEYDETSDQTKCIKELDKDLKSPVPMDRLLCGDVGFGKTEVAFRAMFKAVINGFQVCYLCPTTLLSKQQYEKSLERFREFPINIALLNRFTTTKEFNRIMDGLEKGTIDIVFGTHKLFNKSLVYKNLGLLIIDEEQRFGVSQKEKIKEIKNNINVLTLSATPIPRTLKMAMSGLRDLSIIDTAPINRYPVQTYVLEENDVIIKDAIYKEMSRNGQVFLLYNRVTNLEDYRVKIQKLVPEAKICIAHGKMEKGEIESVIEDFVNGRYDVLLCTTIIETGIDIPNVNTLIVINADTFGLAQLYQLRGRVGRSDKIAYAYLMYNPGKLLNDIAVKRLQSIKDFTELGSGYKIAMRDLSIRGAGNMLGSEQAGFIDSVGIELYTQMVNDEMKRIKGEVVEDEEDSAPLIEVSNHISDNYVEEESLKIEIHKMINEITDKKSLEDIKSQIEDRFGKISQDMEIYMYEEWFEKLANKLNITHVTKTDTLITIELPEDVSNKIDGEKLFLITYNINIKYRLKYSFKRIQISLPLIDLDKHFIYYEVRLLDEIINMTKEK
ncbi:MAG TPA: transcription-repair coupling factor [Bacilli bacterium]|nr:transcription-repair coupling factor [Bacilli bacterium]HQC83253.1 transcription-repair coupling factor [Bacilli bacterium]